MQLKLIVALVSDDKTDTVVRCRARRRRDGATIFTGVRGEGLKPQKTFFGLDLAARRDVVLFLVVETRRATSWSASAMPGASSRSPAPALPSRSRSRTPSVSPPNSPHSRRGG